MKLIEPYYEIWKQSAGLEGIYKQIEKAGKICYKSEHTIKDDSAKPFVDRLISMNHFSVLEHGTVYLNIHWRDDIHSVFKDIFKFYNGNPHSKIIRKVLNEEDLCPDLFISTNYRVLIEHNRLRDLKYLCEPTEFHEKRVTVYFVADIGVIREFFRHRVFSMAQESTRYCNYSKAKFGNELTFILPPWIGKYQEGMSLEERDICGNTYAEICFKEGLVKIEKLYRTLLKEGWKPQEARAILPLCTKGEAVMTGFVSDWQHFFSLRSDIALTGQPHPSASELATPLRDEFIKKGYINERNYFEK